MYIVLWLLFGALVGLVASIVTKKNYRMGIPANIVVGLIGSALGMWLMGVFNFGQPDAFSIEGFLVSVGGAAILIAVFTAMRHK